MAVVVVVVAVVAVAVTIDVIAVGRAEATVVVRVELVGERLAALPRRVAAPVLDVAAETVLLEPGVGRGSMQLD
ncbi:hypothetical protein BE20_08765 [Sorangium cellulosum]|nr:hypothetical protein BE20_08765 [Sorangium cellulosum]